MKTDFQRSAHFTDLKLPPYIKEQLWRHGVVGNAPAMDILSRVSGTYMTSDADAKLFIDDTIRAIKAAQSYAGEFFGHRGGKIPEDVYYSIIGEGLIELMPELFPDMPDSYRSLAAHVANLRKSPDSFLSAKTDGAAKFSFAIQNLLRMENLLHGLRIGAMTFGKEGSSDQYNKLVPAVRNIMKGDSPLTQASQLATRRIDFIINNNDLSRFWYIPAGAYYSREITDKNFVFEKSCIPDGGRLRDAFKSAYQHCETMLDGEGIDAYYDFSEKVMAPIRVLCQREQTFQEEEMLYSFAVETMPSEDGVERAMQASALYPVSEQYIQDDAIARHLSVFHHDTLTYWGGRVEPFVFVGEMAEFHDRLCFVEDLAISNPFLQFYRNYCLEIAGPLYNRMAKTNEVLGFPIYEMPVIPPLPSNDLL